MKFSSRNICKIVISRNVRMCIRDALFDRCQLYYISFTCERASYQSASQLSRDAESARHNYVLKRRKRKEETISKIDDVTCSFFYFHFSDTLSCTLRARHGKRNGSACIVRRMSPMFQTNSPPPPPSPSSLYICERVAFVSILAFFSLREIKIISCMPHREKNT